MYKSIGTYSWPADLAGFEDHYWNVHMPIARSLPGLQAISTFKADESGRESGIYRFAELGWPDKESCEQAMGSPEWDAMLADAAGIVERFDVQITGAMGWEDEPR